MSPPRLFDRRLVRLRRARSAALFSQFDFLHRRAMADIVDRLETVTRDFPQAAFSGAGALTAMLTPACGVGRVLHLDASAARIAGLPLAASCEEEASALASASLDLGVSLLTLHASNDLVGALAQWRAALKPDGLFVAALFGEETLRELRGAFYAAEVELRGGASPRFAPFASVRDLGAALQRAGFALPVADVDQAIVQYKEPARALIDLRGMGETGLLADRGRALTRRIIARAVEIFAESGAQARFDIVYLTGWAPHESQPRALSPGSAKASLAAAVRGGMPPGL